MNKKYTPTPSGRFPVEYRDAFYSAVGILPTADKWPAHRVRAWLRAGMTPQDLAEEAKRSLNDSLARKPETTLEAAHHASLEGAIQAISWRENPLTSEDLAKFLAIVYPSWTSMAGDNYSTLDIDGEKIPVIQTRETPHYNLTDADREELNSMASDMQSEYLAILKDAPDGAKVMLKHHRDWQDEEWRECWVKTQRGWVQVWS